MLFQGLLKYKRTKKPQVNLNIIQWLIKTGVVDQMFIRERIGWRGLLLLANFGKMNKPQTTIANVNQAMLADMIGTTRPLVISL